MFPPKTLPFVTIWAAHFCDLASQILTLLSPLAVLSKSEFEACQQSWSTLPPCPRKVNSLFCKIVVLYIINVYGTMKQGSWHMFIPRMIVRMVYPVWCCGLWCSGTLRSVMSQWGKTSFTPRRKPEIDLVMTNLVHTLWLSQRATWGKTARDAYIFTTSGHCENYHTESAVTCPTLGMHLGCMNSHRNLTSTRMFTVGKPNFLTKFRTI